MGYSWRMETARPIRVLIVDDDEALRQNLVRRYRHLGMEVSDAPSGEELLARPKAGPWDVALLDLHLGGMDGIAVMARLKKTMDPMNLFNPGRLFPSEGATP